jgi:hypothetical protein
VLFGRRKLRPDGSDHFAVRTQLDGGFSLHQTRAEAIGDLVRDDATLERAGPTDGGERAASPTNAQRPSVRTLGDRRFASGANCRNSEVQSNERDERHAQRKRFEPRRDQEVHDEQRRADRQIAENRARPTRG